MLYLREAGWTDADTFTILTKAGEVTPTITGPGRGLDGDRPRLGDLAVLPDGPPDGTGTISSRGREWAFQHVDVGNPQCVIEVGEEVEELDLAARSVPRSSRTGSSRKRTNVSFTSVDGSTVRARIFERGVGETLSSGTGASGAAVAAFLGGAPSPITVKLDGGELTVEITDELDVTLIGTASRVYAGELDRELVRRWRKPDDVDDCAAMSSSSG